MTREEKRAYLNGYRELKNEVTSLMNEHDFWEEKSYELSTPKLERLGIKSRVHKDTVIEHISICQTIKEQIDEAEKKMLEIENVINSLKNNNKQSEADQRSVLRYRYINGLSFWDIKNEMKYSLQNVYYLHRQALDALEINQL